MIPLPSRHVLRRVGVWLTRDDLVVLAAKHDPFDVEEANGVHTMRAGRRRLQSPVVVEATDVQRHLFEIEAALMGLSQGGDLGVARHTIVNEAVLRLTPIMIEALADDLAVHHRHRAVMKQARRRARLGRRQVDELGVAVRDHWLYIPQHNLKFHFNLIFFGN